jgi:hypothetical protein
MTDAAEGAIGTRVRTLLDGLRLDTGVDLVYLGRFADGEQQLRIVVDGERGLRLFEGDRSPVEASFCWQIAHSISPGIIPDTAAEPAVATLPGTVDDGVGGYVSTSVFATAGVPTERSAASQARRWLGMALTS